MNFKSKKLIVFDLDGTLAQSKSSMDVEMSELLTQLLQKKGVAVMSGGSYEQFQNQFLGSLKCSGNLLSSLYLFPTCATSFYRYKNNKWVNIYDESLEKKDRQKIKDSFSRALSNAGFVIPIKLYGELLDDRGTQITFSAFGQHAPLSLKEGWDKNGSKRLYIKKHLEKLLPEFEIRVGGTTSIDVTRKGIDKAYGIKQIEKQLSIPKEDVFFIGDALFEGGNDYPVKEAGVDCFGVTGPNETKEIIRRIIK